jgi:hypothetical protein
MNSEPNFRNISWTQTFRIYTDHSFDLFSDFLIQNVSLNRGSTKPPLAGQAAPATASRARSSTPSFSVSLPPLPSSSCTSSRQSPHQRTSSLAAIDGSSEGAHGIGGNDGNDGKSEAQANDPFLHNWALPNDASSRQSVI